jgi:stage II sporulation protein D (peptidoglycan lytic transglycosylase)
VHRVAVISFVGAVACASTLAGSGSDDVIVDQSDNPVRIALATSARQAKIGAAGSWAIYNRNTADLVTRGTSDELVTIEPRGGRMVVIRANGSATSAYGGPFIIRSRTPGAFLRYEGRRYRGEFVITPNNGGLLVVNRLGVESYLRGVVPIEIGKRQPGEEAAVEAQAVAARSYAYTHMADAGNRGFDMYGSVQDQDYGGVDAESSMSDAAVAATASMVLKYAGRVINAPYHSTCGGSTAAVSEVWWRQPDQPYLRPVSDRIPGTDSYYCDRSGRFRWTATFGEDQLKATLEKYLGSVTPASEPPVSASAAASHPLSLGRITGFRIVGRTPSDRVAAVAIQTDRGTYNVRGNDVRFVLRTPTGSLLSSSYFTSEATPGANGEIISLVLRGGGYGHGIGMCQFGAMGRARAGQDYKTILTTYYPGTTVGRIE